MGSSTDWANTEIEISITCTYSCWKLYNILFSARVSHEKNKNKNKTRKHAERKNKTKLSSRMWERGGECGWEGWEMQWGRDMGGGGGCVHIIHHTVPLVVEVVCIREMRMQSKTGSKLQETN